VLKAPSLTNPRKFARCSGCPELQVRSPFPPPRSAGPNYPTRSPDSETVRASIAREFDRFRVALARLAASVNGRVPVSFSSLSFFFRLTSFPRRTRHLGNALVAPSGGADGESASILVRRKKSHYARARNMRRCGQRLRHRRQRRRRGEIDARRRRASRVPYAVRERTPARARARERERERARESVRWEARIRVIVSG